MPAFRAAALALLLAAPAAAERPGAGVCAGAEEDLAHDIEGDGFFSRRALQMVEAALAHDEAGVRAAVAPDAEFMLWREDYTTSARERGSAGAMQFVEDLRPRRFLLASVQERSISTLVRDCEWKLTILFRTADPAQGVRVEFRFRRGLIVSAEGHEVAIIEGEVRPRTVVNARPEPSE